MTYNLFSGTLNPTQSILASCRDCYQQIIPRDAVSQWKSCQLLRKYTRNRVSKGLQ